MKNEDLKERFNELAQLLVNDFKEDGYWEGELSSSALGVAVAVAALHFDDEVKNSREIGNGLRWLENNINSDGSYGDTPESPGNISTTLLVYAAFNLYIDRSWAAKKVQKKIAIYLSRQGIDVNSSQVAKIILDHYQKDYTFSVPILTMCGLCGVPGQDAFKSIPQLPFELSLLPRKFYRLLNLSVVSYAIPALVAVGIVIYKKKNSSLFWRIIRRFSIKKAMAILHQMMPESGGFLEAIPLTAFVSLSLINSGFQDTEVVKKGIAFLRLTQRRDGGWPIDVDLSTWVTSLAIKAFRADLNEYFTSTQLNNITNHFKEIQNWKIHPFNGAEPGGWGWTNFSGSVPDGDDTPGVILVLLKIQSPNTVKNEAMEGCEWLAGLQNKDGGFPTFSKGWGKLPFDQSCADLTGHGLLAISSVLETYYNSIEESKKNMLVKTFESALIYLEKNQNGDGSWLPLWFGNQLTDNHSNPVYGTARVSTYIKDITNHKWISENNMLRLNSLLDKGTSYLLSVQNRDGSWGGAKEIPGSVEETALAISALSSKEYLKECNAGLIWLDKIYKNEGLKASPIGLYFASLWYDEKMYPVTFYLEALARMIEIEKN